MIYNENIVNYSVNNRVYFVGFGALIDELIQFGSHFNNFSFPLMFMYFIRRKSAAILLPIRVETGLN